MKIMEGLAMTEYVFDIEADSLDATKIHCMVANGKEIDKVFSNGVSV